ncbi:hypothetical protein [Mesoplasma florum]|uniref:hypothetical protein n=1 Tax=Mesoplasma florum TaxID=2151 RepID=UPI000D086E20|nr:hypothetical protein [Mesoplasma florum]AVN61119.1 hypothetical protein CG005_02370 [Mesoplasma florum]
MFGMKNKHFLSEKSINKILELRREIKNGNNELPFDYFKFIDSFIKKYLNDIYKLKKNINNEETVFFICIWNILEKNNLLDEKISLKISYIFILYLDLVENNEFLFEFIPIILEIKNKYWFEITTGDLVIFDFNGSTNFLESIKSKEYVEKILDLFICEKQYWKFGFNYNYDYKKTLEFIDSPIEFLFFKLTNFLTLKEAENITLKMKNSGFLKKFDILVINKFYSENLVSKFKEKYKFDLYPSKMIIFSIILNEVKDSKDLFKSIIKHCKVKSESYKTNLYLFFEIYKYYYNVKSEDIIFENSFENLEIYSIYLSTAKEERQRNFIFKWNYDVIKDPINLDLYSHSWTTSVKNSFEKQVERLSSYSDTQKALYFAYQSNDSLKSNFIYNSDLQNELMFFKDDINQIISNIYNLIKIDNNLLLSLYDDLNILNIEEIKINIFDIVAFIKDLYNSAIINKELIEKNKIENEKSIETKDKIETYLFELDSCFKINIKYNKKEKRKYLLPNIESRFIDQLNIILSNQKIKNNFNFEHYFKNIKELFYYDIENSLKEENERYMILFNKYFAEPNLLYVFALSGFSLNYGSEKIIDYYISKIDDENKPIALILILFNAIWGTYKDGLIILQRLNMLFSTELIFSEIKRLKSKLIKLNQKDLKDTLFKLTGANYMTEFDPLDLINIFLISFSFFSNKKYYDEKLILDINSKNDYLQNIFTLIKYLYNSFDRLIHLNQFSEYFEFINSDEKPLEKILKFGFKDPKERLNLGWLFTITQVDEFEDYLNRASKIWFLLSSEKIKTYMLKIFIFNYYMCFKNIEVYENIENCKMVYSLMKNPNLIKKYEGGLLLNCERWQDKLINIKNNVSILEKVEK